ncbi:MAG: restriction endonuclease subunit S [bacterium]
MFAVVSLPAGVFNPYSGVKTSILFFDNQLAKKAKDILFIKIENDGFDLGAQRRKIDKDDLPLALEIIKKYCVVVETGFKPVSTISVNIPKSQIAENSDYNLSGDRYREVKNFVNQKWSTVELGKITEIQNGLWKGKKPPYINAKVLRNTNFIKKTGFLSFDDIAEIEVEQKQYDKRELIEGDIILENSGGSPTQPVGRVAYFDKDERGFSYSNFTSRIRVIDKNVCNPKYLWNILLHFYNLGKTELLQNQTSGIKNLDKKEYLKIKIPLPPIEAQKEIVEQIEVKQNAIDHAKAIIENLERERRYFGQSLRKPALSGAEGLEGVEWVELGEVCETSSGGTPLKSKNEFYEKGTIPWLRSGEVAQGEISKSELFITEEGLKKSSAKIFPKETVLIAMYGATAGQVGLLKFEATTNQAICGILPDEKFVPEFLYFYLRTLTQEMVKLSGGGAQPNISQTIIKTLKIPLPSLEIQKKLVAEAEKEQQIINTNKQLIEIYEQKISDVLSEI